MPITAWTTISSHWQSWAIGATAGLLNGLIALGGGILVTPFLIAYRRVPPQVAVGTSLVVVVLLSSIGFAAHAHHGNLTIEVRQIAICTLGGILGTVIGSRVLAALTPRWFMKAFAVFLALVSARLVIEGIGIPQLHAVTTPAIPWIALFAIGALTGVMSAIFGVGGGALALLALVTLFGVPLKEGLPTALALNVSNALFGVIHHARNKTILAREVRSLIPSAVVGILVGAWLAQIAPPRALRIVFGFALLVLAVRLLRCR